MSVHIGIIAEDNSDVTVITTLMKKITTKRFKAVHFVGKGCGPLKRKTPAWCKVLSQKGCKSVLLVHDRDRNDYKDLQKKLTNLLAESPQEIKAVVIPSEELEAWLLSDPAALKSAMNLVSQPKKIAHPERIKSPKEFLGKVITENSKGKVKQYVNAVHNLLIAEKVSVNEIKSLCPSFLNLEKFVEDAIGV